MDWSPLLPYAIWAVGTALVYLLRNAGDRRRVADWERIAQQVGLREVVTHLTLIRKPCVVGRHGPHVVTFDRTSEDKDHAYTRVVVTGRSGLSLRREHRHTPVGRALAEREIELGDEPFDDEVLVHGSPVRVRALLDAEMRTVVRRMLKGALEGPGGRTVVVRGRMALVEGNLQAEIFEQGGRPTAGEVAAVTEAMLLLVARFEGRPADMPALLVTHLADEPSWRVRLRGLELLAGSYPNRAETLLAMRRALTDEQPEVRLRAAITLGEEGRPTLRAVATSEVDDATCAHAIDVLGQHLPQGEAQALLRHALRVRRVHTADACIQRLALGGGAEAVAVLCKVVAVERGELAVAAAQALGKLGAGEAEAPLLEALEQGAPELRRAAITALGQVGSALAVLPIREAARDGDDDTRHAARQAIDRIQARLHGASPGQLTVVESEAGQISLAEAEAGRLSIADADPRGRVSLPDASHRAGG